MMVPKPEKCPKDYPGLKLDKVKITVKKLVMGTRGYRRNNSVR